MIATSPFPLKRDNSAFVAAPVYRRWRHLARGTFYTELGRGQLQMVGEADYTRVVIYRGADGQLWVRPEYDFDDGRFEEVPGSCVDQKVLALLQFVAAADGPINASGGPLDMLGHFCEDRVGDIDTFNLAVNSGYLAVNHDSDMDTATARLTAAGVSLLNLYRD
jgi:hypothetical protein